MQYKFDNLLLAMLKLYLAICVEILIFSLKISKAMVLWNFDLL